jgi:CxxC motif-containing protein (DUF1111 family)
VRIDRSDMPLEDATPSELSAFTKGDVLFETVFRGADGLGPLYIRAACVGCHKDDGRGPGTVTRIGLDEAAQSHRATLLPLGDTVRPYFVTPAARPLLDGPLPQGARATHRWPPAVFGRGQMEAVSDAEIERLAEEAARRAGPIQGRIHRVAYHSESNPDQRYHRLSRNQAQLIGRFGLKARIATVDEFTADALQGDMGLTSPLRATEPTNADAATDDRKPGVDVTAEMVNAIADYVRLLAVPERLDHSDAGTALFTTVDCATCHVPRLKTRTDYPIAHLANTEVAVYTDFLLHDMGDALADDVPEGDASGSEWRTAPLIGLRFAPALMHDGRAKSVEQAILAHVGHGSEASESIAKFQKLPPEQRATLLRYVEGL